MTPIPTESSESPPPKDVRLPWETVGAEDPPAAPVEEPEVVAVAVDEEAADDAGAVDYESPVPAEPLVDEVDALGPAPRGGGWTLTLLCAGIALIACCVLIPQADANRRLVYEREKLKLDLESIRKQVAINDDFLKRVADDPTLAERLALRQMKIIRKGTRVLELKSQRRAVPVGSASPLPAADEMSPFHLVHVAPPPPLPPYKPVGGLLAGLCYNPHTRLYLSGVALLLMAVGLVFGFAPRPAE